MIETARLEMRPHTVDDLDECTAMWGDPVVTRYIGGRPFTPEECWARVLRYIGHWTALGYGYWAVRERATGRYVGDVGIADFHRAIEPPIVGEPELGWVLAPWAHGQGYATEAVRAAQAWGDAHLPPSTTVCLIDPANLASLRVAAKCGFVERSRTTYHGDPTIVLTRRHPGVAT